MESNPTGYQAALATRDGAVVLHTAFVQSGGTDEGARNELRRLVPRGLYEHFKSESGDLKFYIVLGANTEIDTHRPTVGYASLYGKRGGEFTNRHMFDPDHGFLTPIRRVEYTGIRFRFIAPLSMREIATLADVADRLDRIRDHQSFYSYVEQLLRRKLIDRIA